MIWLDVRFISGKETGQGRERQIHLLGEGFWLSNIDCTFEMFVWYLFSSVKLF